MENNNITYFIFSILILTIILFIGSYYFNTYKNERLITTTSSTLNFIPTSLSNQLTPVEEGITSHSIKTPNQTYLDFDGVNDYVLIQNNTLFNNDISFSISFDVYVKNFTSLGRIVNKGDVNSGSSASGVECYSNYISYNYIGCIINNQSASDTKIEVVSKANVDTWYNIVYTFDGTTASIYKNGILTENKTVTFTNFTNSNNIYIGRRATSASQFFNGSINNLMLYNRVLSRTEAETIFKNSKANLNYIINETQINIGGSMAYLDSDTGNIYQVIGGKVNNSKDNGNIWEDICTISYCAGTGSGLFVDSRGTIFGSGSGNITMSYGNDTNWTTRRVFGNETAIFRQYGMDEDNLGNLYAGEYAGSMYENNSRIYKSSDGGFNWEIVFNGSEYDEFDARHIHLVQVDPYNDYIYAVTGDIGNRSKLIRSIDYGENWETLQIGKTEYQYTTIVFTPEYRIFGTDIGDGTANNKIVRTSDDINFENLTIFSNYENGYLFGMSRDNNTGLICVGTEGLENQRAIIVCSYNNGDDWFLAKDFGINASSTGVQVVTDFNQEGYAVYYTDENFGHYIFNIKNNFVELSDLQLQENNGTIAYDSSGNANHGTILGATWNNDGILNTLVNEVDYSLNTATGVLTLSSSYLYSWIESSWDYYSSDKNQDYNIANNAEIGLGEFGNWFIILVLISIIGFIFYIFFSNKGGYSGGY